jgi:hypothetical protein
MNISLSQTNASYVKSVYTKAPKQPATAFKQKAKGHAWARTNKRAAAS